MIIVVGTHCLSGRLERDSVLAQWCLQCLRDEDLHSRLRPGSPE